MLYKQKWKLCGLWDNSNLNHRIRVKMLFEELVMLFLQLVMLFRMHASVGAHTEIAIWIICVVFLISRHLLELAIMLRYKDNVFVAIWTDASQRHRLRCASRLSSCRFFLLGSIEMHCDPPLLLLKPVSRPPNPKAPLARLDDWRTSSTRLASQLMKRSSAWSIEEFSYRSIQQCINSLWWAPRCSSRSENEPRRVFFFFFFFFFLV
jgi:hypothetical protein